ncbi:hypothetical protein SHIRM173S_11390 [Streptomyces hirsutus]
MIVHSGPDHMRTVVALPLDTVDGATTKLLWLSLGLGIAVAVGVVALGNGAVRLGLRPLTRVEYTAQHITDGALELNVPVADPDTEVGRLGLALNTMLNRLRTALHRTETPKRSCATSWRTPDTNCAPRSPPSRVSPNSSWTNPTCQAGGARRHTP